MCRTSSYKGMSHVQHMYCKEADLRPVTHCDGCTTCPPFCAQKRQTHAGGKFSERGWDNNWTRPQGRAKQTHNTHGSPCQPHKHEHDVAPQPRAGGTPTEQPKHTHVHVHAISRPQRIDSAQWLVAHPAPFPAGSMHGCSHHARGTGQRDLAQGRRDQMARP
jgi:hypothetical protein